MGSRRGGMQGRRRGGGVFSVATFTRMMLVIGLGYAKGFSMRGFHFSKSAGTSFAIDGGRWNLYIQPTKRHASIDGVMRFDVM